MATDALITRGVLRWARQRLYSDIDVAASHLNFNAAKLEEWEEGGSLPTFRQAQELASKLRIPLGYLYLDEPPKETLPLLDLRTKPGGHPRQPSPDLLEVVYDALRKQEWYHDYLIAEQADKVPFVGKFNGGATVESVAAEITQALRLDQSLRREARDLDDFFNRLTSAAEIIGIVVMRNSVVGKNTSRPLDLDEFQGFAICDEFAPLVFVNTRDFLSAQVFTLVHELAHIWKGVTGVSSIIYLARADDQRHDSERIADAIAAEVLVPGDDFDYRWDLNASLDSNLANLSKYYRVSRFVVLRRAFDRRKVGFDTYQTAYQELRSQIHPKNQRGGGDFYKNVFSRNSSAVTSALVYAAQEGRISLSEAAKLLNVRALSLQSLEVELASRRRRGMAYA